MRFILAVLALLAVAPAFAQQPTQPQSPAEQALSGKLQDEINQDMAVRQVLATANAQLAQALARVKELETKYEPKAAPPANADNK